MTAVAFPFIHSLTEAFQGREYDPPWLAGVLSPQPGHLGNDQLAGRDSLPIPSDMAPRTDGWVRNDDRIVSAAHKNN